MKPKYTLCALTIAALLVVSSVSVAGAAPASSSSAVSLSYGSNCYTVRLGDNLYRISLRLGVSVYALMQANGITNPNRIYAGQVLCMTSARVVNPYPPRLNCNTGIYAPECRQPVNPVGWRGEFYNNEGLAGAPSFIRYDPAINFDWGLGWPDRRINPVCFSVRWTRTVWLNNGTYHFITTTDDGVRLWVDNVLVIDQWQEQPSATYFADVPLGAAYHSIRMEYMQLQGVSQAHLSWQLASPYCSSCNNYCPSCNNNGNVIYAGAWFGQYYDNMFLQGDPTFTRADAALDFDWGIHGPGGDIEGSMWSARWQQQAFFAGGKYRFHAIVDDGVRIFVDGKVVMDHWEDNPGYEHLSDTNVSGGTHQIRVEYFQRGHEAKIKVWWEKLY